MIDIEGVLLPALFERLDTAFPEFGWVRDSRGWRATNEQTCKSTTGASQRRVVCHRPVGFYAHGAGNTTWFQYLTGERSPRGEAFTDALKELCARAGVTYTARPITEEEREEIERRQKLGSVLEDIWQVVRNELQVEELNARKKYLVSRDLSAEPDGVDVGYCHRTEAVCKALYDRGYTPEELSLAGFTSRHKETGEWQANTLWNTRIVGKYLSKRGHIVGLWGRSTEPESKRKYVNTTGFDWNEHPVSKATGGSRERLVLVEGVFEPEIFKTTIPDIASIGGAGNKCTKEFWEDLYAQGTKTAVLLLDSDEPGLKGREAALAGYRRADRRPALYVAQLPEGIKDADECRRAHGTNEVQESIRNAKHVCRFVVESTLADCPEGTEWTDEARNDAARALIKEAAHWDVLERSQYFLPAIQHICPSFDSEGLAELVAEQERKQQEKQALVKLASLAQGLTRDVKEAGLASTVQNAIRELQSLVPSEHQTIEPIRSVAETLEPHKQWLNEYRGKGPMIGLPQVTLPEVDRSMMGLRGLIILPGPPNTGKSALGHQFGMDVVTNNDNACFVYVALEMRKEDHINRMWSRLAGMDYKTFRTGSSIASEPMAAFTNDELTRLHSAEVQLNVLGSRILILDKSNCPHPTAEGLKQIITDFKVSTGCERCFVLVDYLQRWPVPAALERELVTDLQKDDWRMEQMEKLCTSPDDPVVVISAQAKHEATGSFGKLARVKGSGSGSYSPDAALFIRPADDEEVYKQRMKYDIDPSTPPSKAEKLKEKLEEMGVYKELAKNGWQWCWLELVKGRDGMERFELPITFHFRQSSFTEGWAMPPVWVNAQREINAA